MEARQRLGRDAENRQNVRCCSPSSGPMSTEAAAAWFERLGAAGTIEWVVEAQGAFLGTARLHSFRDDSARYAVGFFDPDRLGQGFGKEVSRIVVEYAFASLGLRRVDLAVLEFNQRAIRCYERCGFRKVGRLANAAVIEGQPYADVLMEVGPETLVESP